MKIVWCDRTEGDTPSTPSFKQMRVKLREKLENDIMLVSNAERVNMKERFSSSDFDIIVIGPFASDLDCWDGLGELKIPKVMFVSDPQSDIAYHVYYARKYKVNALLFLYPAWIPIYQKYLNCKMFEFPWWLNDCKQEVEKTIDVANQMANSPFHPVRWHVSEDKRLDKNITRVSFGLNEFRLGWKEYVELLNKTKLLVFDGSFWNLPILKYVEGMVMQCCMLAPSPEREDVLHLKPYENYVPVTVDNYYDKILEYLDDYEAAKKIAYDGRKTFLKYHTTEIRMNELLQKLGEVINGQT
jgi:hypothetical protein